MTRLTSQPAAHVVVWHGQWPELSSPLQYLCVAMLTAGSAALRIVHLTTHGLTMDEGFSAYLGRTTAANFIGIVWNSEFNMVLYYGLLRAWMHVGHSESVIRLLGVFFAAATIPAIFLVARHLFADGWTPLVAALLLAVHPFHVMLAQDARSYSLMILLVTLASLFFLRMLDNPSWNNAAAYALFAALAVYSHFFALLAILSHAAALLFYPGKLPWKFVVLAVTLLVVLLLPFVSFLLLHGSVGHVAWVVPLHGRQIFDLLYALSVSKLRSLTYVLTWTIALVAAVIKSREQAWPYRFTATLLLGPVLMTLVVSIWRPLLVERFLSVCIPGSALLAAAGLVVAARFSPTAAIALLALTVFYSASNIRHYFRNPEYSERWREASAYLLKRAEPTDVVVLLPGLAPPTFDYYRELNSRKLPGLILLDSAEATLPNPLPQNVWFIGSVLLTPNWATEAAVFAKTHKGIYCEEAAQSETGSVRVWQFHLCKLEARADRLSKGASEC